MEEKKFIRWVAILSIFYFCKCLLFIILNFIFAFKDKIMSITKNHLFSLFCSLIFSINTFSQSKVDTITYTNGSKYIGELINGNFHGFGIFSYSNGDKYEGNWINGKRTGQGKYTWPSGSISIGYWIDGELNGIGYQYKVDKSEFFGEYTNGLSNGFYWKFQPNGEVSFGEATNNRLHKKSNETFKKPDFQLNKPSIQLYNSINLKSPSIKSNFNDLSKSEQIEVLKNHLLALKEFQSRIEADFQKEEEHYEGIFNDLGTYLQTILDINVLINNILEKKKEGVESLKKENSSIISEIKALSVEKELSSSIKSTKAIYPSCSQTPTINTDQDIGKIKTYSFEGVSVPDSSKFANVPIFKSNKKGQILKLHWQIDSLGNAINLTRFDFYNNVNPNIVAIDIALENKNEELNERSSLLLKYACLTEEMNDWLAVLNDNKIELKNIESKINISTVTIGKQVWMTQNLNVDKFRNGDLIPEAKSDEEWERAGENKQPVWCYYNRDPANGSKYGKLYNWYAVNDPRGLAPKGWHVSSEKEWEELINYLGGYKIAAEKIKSNSWANTSSLSPDDYSSTCQNDKGNNESGFSAFPGGSVAVGGDFNFQGLWGYWWTSSEIEQRPVTYRTSCSLNFEFNDGKALILSEREYNGQLGLSVRCVKD